MKTSKLLSLIGILSLSSCAPILIGDVTEISTRNMDSKTTYTQLKSYAAYDNSSLRSLKGTTIQEAVDNLVRSVPGGEFIRNVKIYKVEKEFAVNGDVWGVAGQEANYSGFQVADKVSEKEGSKWYIGTIIALQDDKTCLVKWDEDGRTSSEKYKDLTKIQSNGILQSSYYGFYVNDRVSVKDANSGQYLNGTIAALKDDKKCLVKFDDGTTDDVAYKDLIKIQK